MMKKIATALFYLLTITLIAGCDILNQDSYHEYIVIESYAYAGSPYPDIKISITLPADAVYDKNEAAVKDATVRLARLDENGNPVDRVEYTSSETTPGTYYPLANGFIIEEGNTYRFDIEIPDRDPIRAQTTVPRQLHVVNDIPSEVVYQSENQLEIVLANPGQESFRTFYLFSSTALEPSEEELTPFYKATVENDEEIDYTEFISTDSGLISESNFDVNSDGTITLTYPWIGVSFYGQNRIVTFSVDKNTYDLVRTQSVQLGGSNLSPGEIPNLIYNVEGAIGVFGSMSADTVYTSFVRP